MGAIVNTIAVIAGGLIGLFFKRGIKEKYRDGMMKALGVATMFIGMAGALARMLVIEDGALSAEGSILIAVSLSFGTLIGEFLDIEDWFERLGTWLKAKAKSNDSGFINAFVTTSLTICIGAMAIVGSLQDGLLHDPGMLYTKALLDFLIVIVFAAALGVGSVFAALPILVIEGSLTLLSGALAGVLTSAVIANLAMAGNILIFVVGWNLFTDDKMHVRVANMLPGLLVAAALTFFL